MDIGVDGAGEVDVVCVERFADNERREGFKKII